MYVSCLLCVSSQNALGPCLRPGNVAIHSLGTFVQVVYNVVVVVGSVVVHVSVLQELWPGLCKGSTINRSVEVESAAKSHSSLTEPSACTAEVVCDSCCPPVVAPRPLASLQPRPRPSMIAFVNQTSSDLRVILTSVVATAVLPASSSPQVNPSSDILLSCWSNRCKHTQWR